MNAHPRILTVVFVALLITSAMLHRAVRSVRASMSQDYRPLAAKLTDVAPYAAPFTFVRDVPLDSRVVAAAHVDEYIYQEYVDPTEGVHVSLYVGYWGRVNTGSGHGPDVCLPSIGWKRVGEPETRSISLVARNGNTVNAEVALHRFERTSATGMQHQVVGFVAVVDGEFRRSSRGLFFHRPPSSSADGYLAHVEAATPVIGGQWAASEERIIRFMAAVLPAVDRCL